MAEQKGSGGQGEQASEPDGGGAEEVGAPASPLRDNRQQQVAQESRAAEAAHHGAAHLPRPRRPRPGELGTAPLVGRPGPLGSVRCARQKRGDQRNSLGPRETKVLGHPQKPHETESGREHAEQDDVLYLLGREAPVADRPGAH